MDWSLLKLFKQANFNTLMFSLAVTGWILIYIHPENFYILIIAILCSIYSVTRFTIYLYKKISRVITERINEQNQIEENKRQALYVYDRLSENSKRLLSNIINKATKTSYSDVYILLKPSPYSHMVIPLKQVLGGDTKIKSWVSIEETKECISIYIKFPLNEIIKSSDKNNLNL